MNRAVQDDIVAVEILPESEWTAPSSLVLEEKDEELAEEEQEKNVNQIVHISLSHSVCCFNEINSLWENNDFHLEYSSLLLWRFSSNVPAHRYYYH